MMNKDYRKTLNEFISEEGGLHFELAPLSKLPTGLPEAWKEILVSSNAVRGVLEKLWLPWLDLLPETISELQQKLRSIGLLQTQQIPFSLIYCFQYEDEYIFRRGYPCQLIEREEAKKLPREFLDLYKIHDGWSDIHGFAGFMRSKEWFDLTCIFIDQQYSDIMPGVRLEDFLVICDSGGTGYLGFDLSKNPPVGLECFFHNPVEVVPDVVRKLDELMAVQLHDLD